MEFNMKARLPEGFGGGGGNMNQMLKQAQKMQEEMAKVQEELQNTEFKASSGGGAVEVIISGNKQIKSLNIKPEVIDPEDKEMLEDLIIAAVNDCLAQIEKKSEEQMSKSTGGLNIPGLF
jgi:nucleoid-associated protein EbfC